MVERSKLTLQDIKIIDRYSSKYLACRYEEAVKPPVLSSTAIRDAGINIKKENEKIV